MYNSIAPVELTTQMRRQFGDIVVTVQESAPRPVRHLVSVALRALANRLEPVPSTR
jgi:hypothetical protein